MSPKRYPAPKIAAAHIPTIPSERATVAPMPRSALRWP